MGIFGKDVAEHSVSASELIPVAIPAAALGLASTILCASPGDSGGYPAAAALDAGSLNPPTNTEAISSFVEDLFRLGRIEIGNFGDAETQILQPNVRKMHILTKTESGPLLTRETFDCGFD